MSEKIIAYKGMNADMTCRGKQYEVGKTYHEDKADCCHAGMHACENPLDVLHYYPLSDGIRIFKVECGGDISREDGKDTKLACTELTVEAEIKIADMVKLGVKAVMDRVSKNVKGTKNKASGYKFTGAASGNCSTGAASGNCCTGAASGDWSTGAASGDWSTGAASGDWSTGAASGDWSTGAASGYKSTGAASGYKSTGAASGDCSTGAASGNCSTGAASGNCSTGAASGDCSTGAASGNCSTGAASGDWSTGAASGNWSTGAASGDWSTGAASGEYCKAEAFGKDSIAVANGAHSKARGAMGCYLVLTEYDNNGSMICAKMSQVDGKTIKENVWYTLKNGEFVEVQP